MGLPCLGVVGCLWTCCLAAHLLQVGFRLQLADLVPDFSRLSPLHGFGKMLRFDNARQAVWGLLKFLSVLTIGGWCLWSSLGQLSALTDCEVSTIAQVVGGSVMLLAWQLAALFAVFGLADYGYQVWKFEQSLKMSPAEVREELRNDSGDPHWKQMRRDLWRRQSSIQSGPNSQSTM